MVPLEVEELMIKERRSMCEVTARGSHLILFYS